VPVTFAKGLLDDVADVTASTAEDDQGEQAWTLASFATTPQPELGDRAPVDTFGDADIEPLLLSAHRTAADLKR
jgi:hypothetical protein